VQNIEDIFFCPADQQILFRKKVRDCNLFVDKKIYSCEFEGVETFTIGE
jgi:hypothetical protein